MSYVSVATVSTGTHLCDAHHYNHPATSIHRAIGARSCARPTAFCGLMVANFAMAGIGSNMRPARRVCSPCTECRSTHFPQVAPNSNQTQNTPAKFGYHSFCSRPCVLRFWERRANTLCIRDLKAGLDCRWTYTNDIIHSGGTGSVTGRANMVEHLNHPRCRRFHTNPPRRSVSAQNIVAAVSVGLYRQRHYLGNGHTSATNVDAS